MGTCWDGAQCPELGWWESKAPGTRCSGAAVTLGQRPGSGPDPGAPLDKAVGLKAEPAMYSRPVDRQLPDTPPLSLASFSDYISFLNTHSVSGSDPARRRADLGGGERVLRAQRPGMCPGTGHTPPDSMPGAQGAHLPS